MCFVLCNLYFVRKFASFFFFCSFYPPYCVSNFLCNLFRISFSWMFGEKMKEKRKTVYFSHYFRSHFSLIFLFACEIILWQAEFVFFLGWKICCGVKCSYDLSQHFPAADKMWESKESFVSLCKHHFRGEYSLNSIYYYHGWDERALSKSLYNR